MKTISTLLITTGLLMALGCASQRPSVQPVYVNGIGFAVDFAAVQQPSDGLWQTYRASWASAPWLMAATHLGTIAAGYVVGQEAGWWGGSSGGRSSTTNNTRAQTTGDGGWNVDFGTGDGDRSIVINHSEGAP